jgi:hypothetical protein
MEPNDSEKSAVEIVYERESGTKQSFERIPSSDRDEILKQVRARALSIEEFVTHDMLVRRIGEDRWTPRRYMLASLAVAAIVGAVSLLILGFAYLLGFR